MELVVAARGSKLSLKQVEIAMQSLAEKLPGLQYRVLVVKTRGDRVQDRPLYAIGGKGLFEKEVNLAVLRGEADIAVHSMKDLPGEIDERLEIVYLPPRGPVNEALVPRQGLPAPRDLSGLGGRVGTSSVRRKALLLHYSSNIAVEPIRGNLDTRLRKLDSGLYDYIVVAEAGLRRLGVERPYTRLPVDQFPPAPGQGLIAVVARRDSPLAERLKRLVDPATKAMAVAERSFLRHASAGCHVPLGGVALPTGTGLLKIIAVVLSPDGSKAAWIKLKGDMEKAEGLGAEAGEIAYTLSQRLLAQQ